MHTHTTHTLRLSMMCAMLLHSGAVIAQEVPAIDTAALMAAGQPFTQKIVMTAYYSPLPDQCCYVKGSFEADKILNGNGTNGADGTEVYPGMIAAPKSYPFGTRIDVPGLGVFTVHDRGGAIIEQEGAHRIDVWVGAGEEGLARALAFGVRRATATVYPPASAQPAEAFGMASLAAPMGALKAYTASAPVLTEVKPAFGQKGPSVTLLQEKLQNAGFLAVAPTGYFGPATKEALQAFRTAMALEGTEDTIDETTGALLEAYTLRKGAKDPVALEVDRLSTPSVIAQAQRTLRFLGYYSGRTDGKFSDALFAAIVSFQQEHKLVGDAHSPGAGRIGPKTRAVIITLWNREHVRRKAQEILDRKRVTEIALKKGLVPSRFFGKGEKGEHVRVLQTMLHALGLLDSQGMTGLFGDRTEAALVQYQMKKDIVASPADNGAGYVGPSTLASIRAEREKALWLTLRARGWDAL